VDRGGRIALKSIVEQPIKTGQFTVKGREKIEEICKKAAVLFSEKGYQEATLADVSKAAGITKAGIYHYFTTKEELLFLILNRYMSEVLERARGNFAKKAAPKEKLRGFIKGHIQYLDENLHESRLIINQWHNLAPKYREVIRVQQREYVDLLKTGIESLLGDSGRSADDRKLVAYILMSLCNAPYNWYRAGGKFSPERIAEEVFRIFTGQLFEKRTRLKCR
jgi:TetR/AcrR family transcriptional regulator, cholesterol catabolism regulator